MHKHWRFSSGEIFRRLREVPKLEVLGLSHDRGWSGISCALVLANHPEPIAWTSPDTLISFLLTGAAQLEWRQGGVMRHRPWNAENICIFSGQEPHELRCSGRVLMLHCAVTPELLQQAGQLQCACNHVKYQIANHIGFQDHSLWRIGQAILAELTSPSGPHGTQQDLLNLAIGDYLLRKSPTCHQCRSCVLAHSQGPGLHSERVFDSIQRALNFILTNLGEEGLSIDRIAAEVGLSPYHFARTFRASLGIPPHKFIVEQRIIQAQNLLEHSSKSAADVAFACGFSSQSHLNSTFRRLVGSTPLAYRRAFQNSDRDAVDRAKGAS